MYYNLSTIKSQYFNTNLIEDSSRASIVDFFDIKKLVNNSIINTIYIKSGKVFLLQRQLEFIFEHVKFKTGIVLNINDHDIYYEVVNDIQIYKIDNFLSIQALLKEQKKKASKLTKNEFNISNLPDKAVDKKIVSFDFEFRQLGSTYQILELGICIYKNGNYKNFHYIIEERKDVSEFSFGQSIIIEEKDILNKLIEHTRDADYLVGHSLNCELNILKSNSKEEDFKHLYFIDTSNEIIYTKFTKKFKKQDKNQISLKNSLSIFNIPTDFIHLHNAGNDAQFTMKLFLQMVKFKKNKVSIEKK